jgi:hypothetical protein
MNVNSVTITINNYENDAMVNDRTGETIKILKGLVERLESGDGIVSNFDGLRLVDSNGNSVGEVEVDWDEEDYDEYDYDDSMDGDHESGLASAGWGTDEDYGYFGGGEDW